MEAKSLLPLALACLTIGGLSAAPTAPMVTSLGFDQLKPGEDVLTYYNGGFGSLGTGPGPSDGVVFGPGWIAGPPNVFPDIMGNSVAITGTAVVSIPLGWSGPTSFYYPAGAKISLQFFDQVNGGGNLVGTLTLPETPQFCFSSILLCPTGASEPLFRSIVFQTTGTVRLDSLTNGAFVVPEPATTALVLFGVAILGVVRRSALKS